MTRKAEDRMEMKPRCGKPVKTVHLPRPCTLPPDHGGQCSAYALPDSGSPPPVSKEEPRETREARWTRERMRAELATFIKEHWTERTAGVWSVTITAKDSSDGDFEIDLRGNEITLRFRTAK